MIALSALANFRPEKNEYESGTFTSQIAVYHPVVNDKSPQPRTPAYSIKPGQ